MTKVFTMKPLEGIAWNDKSINLKDSKDEVRASLGQPEEANENAYYYFNNELRIDFDEKGCVEFIEFLGGIDGEIQPEIYGIKAFQVKSNELLEYLETANDGDIDDSENGYAYAFLNISVGIYRGSTEADIEEMITEMKEESVAISDNEDIEYERKKAEHWSTIGIGTKGYYAERK